MSQLYTLFWLRYRVFINSMTTRGEIVRTVLNTLLLLIPVILSIGIGIALFVAIIAIPEFREPVIKGGMTTVLATLLLLMLISQSTGASSHFDPRRYLLFPINLSKLFFLNLLSALGEFSMLMVLPSMAGMLIGLGIAYHSWWGGVLAFSLALLWMVALFICTGMVFAWLLSGRKRSREVFFALLIGAFTATGQLLPRFLSTEYGTELLVGILPYQGAILRLMDWTPIGVWSYFFTELAAGQTSFAFLHLLAVNALWTSLALLIGYIVFKRLATNPKASSASSVKTDIQDIAQLKRNFIAVRLPFFSRQTSAIFAKELKYYSRNPATYLTALSSLIFPLIMFRSIGNAGRSARFSDSIWIISIWVSYVLMLNLQYFGGLFSYDSSGFRQYLLSPLNWKRLLLGKNMAIWLVVSVQISLIIGLSQLIDRNISQEKLFTAICCSLIALALYSVVGNYISIYFPSPVNFGVPAKRKQNWSGINLLIQFGLLFGVAGLLLLPIGAGAWFRNPVIRYVLFIVFTFGSWVAYFFCLGKQGEKLAARRFEISEAINRKTEKN
jgi:hypothetical protein